MAYPGSGSHRLGGERLDVGGGNPWCAQPGCDVGGAKILGLHPPQRRDVAQILRVMFRRRLGEREFGADGTGQISVVGLPGFRSGIAERGFGPINATVILVTADAETGEERESHRRPNLAPFADDPDCWLVASIEDFDIESGLARMGPIFRERVIAPPSAPLIATAADALAVTLNETGRVDVDHLAELLDRDPETALAQLGGAVFRNPQTEAWETDDAYLSGSVRTKLAQAEAAAANDPRYGRNVAALRQVQPEDLPPSDITARLGAPWIPVAARNDVRPDAQSRAVSDAD